jgi:predicted nucleic acid-binding Zn ribbon protein
MSDDPLVHCPDCGEATLQKELSAPKFRLKGSGWYETDFKTGDKRNLHGQDADSKSKKAKDTSDATPAAKAD